MDNYYTKQLLTNSDEVITNFIKQKTEENQKLVDAALTTVRRYSVAFWLTLLLGIIAFLSDYQLIGVVAILGGGLIKTYGYVKATMAEVEVINKNQNVLLFQIVGIAKEIIENTKAAGITK
ncbi:MAG: hypothetical protein OEQ39_15105 [Gammaproteobacteria bacterium]|nr:hypothetical protein [Gammaproteobacteria bacterium]